MKILSTKLKNRFSEEYTVSLKNVIVNGDKRGCTGFISSGNAIVYVNTEPCGRLGFMYRTAKHLNDYTGGVNRWAPDIDSLVSGVKHLLLAEKIRKESGIPADKIIFTVIGD